MEPGWFVLEAQGTWIRGAGVSQLWQGMPKANPVVLNVAQNHLGSQGWQVGHLDPSS